MIDNKLHLGFSPLTGRVYLGKQRNDLWVGEKRDVTSEFTQVMLQIYEPGETRTITVNGVPKYSVTVKKMEEK
jgi:hypothetical protein